MHRSLRLAGWLLAALACAGCRTGEPPYRVEDVAFDEHLVGTWLQESPPVEEGSKRAPVRVSARVVSVKEGRLDQFMKDMAPIRAGPGGETGYRTTYSIADANPAAEKSEAGMSSLSAYLLRAGDQMFVGVQIAPEQVGLLNGFAVIPVHVLWMCDRTGDTLTLRAPRRPVAWAPHLRSVDAAANHADVPDVRAPDDGTILFTHDLDRLLRIYRAHARDESFWEEARVYRRIGD